MLRPWTTYPIRDCGENLKDLPSDLFRLEPHPYLSLGAPYIDGFDPWRLRESVVEKLLLVQQTLLLQTPPLRLAIFDAWRPIQVQSFMYEHSIVQTCLNRGLDSHEDRNSPAFQSVLDEVSMFWAEPSFNPKTPPPHSTGGAVDLTLANANFIPVDMGGEIDEISSKSFPDYFAKAYKANPQSKFRVLNERRSLLANEMETLGFVQHPYEWWHFSYGDQLWAWQSNSHEAIYGSCAPSERSANTF